MTTKMLSMTAFGQSSIDCENCRIEIEVKSVNHRFLDVVIRSPRVYAPFDLEFKAIVSSVMKRGKVDVSIVRKTITSSQIGGVKLDRALYDQYFKLYKDVLSEHGAGVTPDVMSGVIPEILSKPGVMQNEELEVPSLEKEKELVIGALSAALEVARGMRLREGAIIEKELECRLNAIEAGVGAITGLAHQVTQTLGAKLALRVQALSSSEVDTQRIAQEVAILADRCDISEELSRLQSHCGAFRSRMRLENSGKELDFLSQEINRELNTLSAKAQSAEVSQKVVAAKGELEKIREQLQNIE